MAKKTFIILVMLLCGIQFLQAATIPLGVVIEDNTPSIPGGNKAPIRPWSITQDGNVLTMSSTPCDYTLSLYDEDGYEVYTTFVPAGTTMIVLPATLSGTFEIRFEADTYYYYGDITL